MLAARLVGKKGKVYSFEPRPRNYGLLCKNIELNGYDNVYPIQAAVSNIAEKGRLFLANETGAHTIRPCHDTRYFNNKHLGEFVEVETVVLDDFFKDKEHTIDIIKMDIEGAEIAALLGMDKLIRRNNKLKIVAEFFPSAIREMGYFPEEFAGRLLDDYGFSIEL